ncbi:GntR family transcriptional regulator [Cereibacter sphaeroides]|uniref:GntR family transcriptional regulator n=1 Tax=Cereibacter sphaeroides TaxID=1063 RepID=UPI001F2AF72B|nr:GntR family transcriptional regulator [Cereibacter sphaeroides]MCE6952951.1 GntR family transcriptional regulator [Cereibacter sphaeroides]
MNIVDELRPRTIARERFDTIYLTLRDRICLLDYEPGTRLGEEELAREFGVSRTPLRRVLSRLEAEGLVESRHGVGTFVTTVDLEGLIETYKLRMELAELIGRLDPLPRSEEDLARIRALVAQCDALRLYPDARRYARLNMLFFQQVAQMIGNQPLREITERLYYLTHRIWLTSVPHLNLSDEIEVFHREIVDTLAALELGDFEAVGYIRRSHISMSVHRMGRFASKS